MSIIRFFIPIFVCVLTIKDRKHTKQNFDSVAGVMLRGGGGDLGMLGGLKTLAWGFAMSPIDCAF